MRVIFSDLDGTLLDARTYSFEAALPALQVLKREQVPLVAVTSKTRAETERWQTRLGIRGPFVVENGGAAYLPGRVEQFGAPYGLLLEALHRASRDAGCRILGFHDMSVEEVAAATGLEPAEAELARRREYDEPFLILDPERSPRLLAGIEAAGFHWTRGGRFFHITGGHDKAQAVSFLLAHYREAAGQVESLGLGDSPNDAGFLAVVDQGIMLTRGPEEWNESVLAFLARR